MSQTKRIKTIAFLGIIVAIFSLGLSLSILHTSYSDSGIAVEEKKNLFFVLNGLSEVQTETDSVRVIEQPRVQGTSIVYGMELLQPEAYSQFQFHLYNQGNIDGKIKKIKITGYEEYQDYVEIHVDGIQEGDIIPAGAILKKIKVFTQYKKPFYDESNLAVSILLKQIKIDIEFEEV